MRLPDSSRSRAVLIGTARYDDGALHDLPGVTANLTDLAACLTDDRHGSFRHCRVVADPRNTAEVGELLADESDQAGDTLLVYYAGHGLLDLRGELYLALASTNSKRAAYTAMPFTFIRRAFLDSPATNRVLVLDCCFSGRAIEAMADPDSVVSGQIEISGGYTLTSSAANQPSTAPDGARHTAFTGELLRLLTNGVQTGGELITLDQAYRHLLTSLSTRGLPKPQSRGTGTIAQLALSRNAAWQRSRQPGDLPQDIHHDLASDNPKTRQAVVPRLAVLLRSSDSALAQAAHATLVNLTDDDSRMVIAAAELALREHEQTSRTPPPTSTSSPGRLLKSVGICFGTTNSSICVLDDNGLPVVVANAEGATLTPSVVSIEQDGGVLVGERARSRTLTNVDSTARSVKRNLASGLILGGEGRTWVPADTAARILRKLKDDAEARLGGRIEQVVLTVPASFGQAERQMLSEAGRIAGLGVWRLSNEPTAAALGYFRNRLDVSERIAVIDLGGGGYDVSIVDCADGVVEVRASSGDPQLGGDDWDQRIVDWLLDRFRRTWDIDLREYSAAMHRLVDAAEQTKIQLSSMSSVEIRVPYLAVDHDGEPVHLAETLTRVEFEQFSSDLLERLREPFETVLRDTGITAGELDYVLLVGGATRMPAVVDFMRRFTGRPTRRDANPDELVAIGAAVQAGIMSGQVRDILPLDVTPTSWGIETKGGVFTKLIHRNTSIPTKHVETFTTAEDNQKSFTIQVYQGESEWITGNRPVGRFELVDLAPAAAGVPQIEVSFEIDPNGMLIVTARDLGTDQPQTVTVDDQWLKQQDLGRRVPGELNRE